MGFTKAALPKEGGQAFEHEHRALEGRSETTRRILKLFGQGRDIEVQAHGRADFVPIEPLSQ